MAMRLLQLKGTGVFAMESAAVPHFLFFEIIAAIAAHHITG
jgi:hypothetical protein